MKLKSLVRENNSLVPVEVEAKSMHGDQWLITGGLKGGEKVIVENAATMMPGSKVNPVSSSN